MRKIIESSRVILALFFAAGTNAGYQWTLLTTVRHAPIDPPIHSVSAEYPFFSSLFCFFYYLTHPPLTYHTALDRAEARYSSTGNVCC